MEIRIGHLYYNILNLYGTPSEIIVIKQQLEHQGFTVIIDELELHDRIDFNNYDFIYLGASTEDNMLMCMEDLFKYKEEIKLFIENKIVYASGNSVNMFAEDIDNNEALGILDFKVNKLNKRVISEAILQHNDIKQPLIGVINQHYVISNNEKSTFSLLEAIKKYPSTKEGYEEKGFIGTNLVGPPVCRNPYFAEYVVSKIIRAKSPDFCIRDFNLEEEKDAYDYFMYRYHKDLQ